MQAYLIANAIAADAGLIPGLAICGPAMGLPLSVLAAFVERPFVTRCGFKRHAIWYSLRANFVSLLVGYVATFFILPVIMSPNGDIVMLIWPFLAVGLSIVTERTCLDAQSSNNDISWSTVAAANIVSAVVCIFVMILAASIREVTPQLNVKLRAYENGMNFLVTA